MTGNTYLKVDYHQKKKILCKTIEDLKCKLIDLCDVDYSDNESNSLYIAKLTDCIDVMKRSLELIAFIKQIHDTVFTLLYEMLILVGKVGATFILEEKKTLNIMFHYKKKHLKHMIKHALYKGIQVIIAPNKRTSCGNKKIKKKRKTKSCNAIPYNLCKLNINALTRDIRVPEKNSKQVVIINNFLARIKKCDHKLSSIIEILNTNIEIYMKKIEDHKKHKHENNEEHAKKITNKICVLENKVNLLDIYLKNASNC